MVNEDVAQRLIEPLIKMVNAQRNRNITETERCMAEFNNLLRAAQRQITNDGGQIEQDMIPELEEILQLREQFYDEQHDGGPIDADMTAELEEILQLRQQFYDEKKSL